jgi:hypothetical protein
MDKDKLIDFLAAGVSQRAAAAACGISDSLVSQLLSTPEFQDALALKKADAIAANVAYDARIDQVEDTVLRRVEATAPMITDPMKAMKALQMLSSVRRRNIGAQLDSTPTTVITLDLPAAAKVAISLSQDKQVIAIDGRSTATLPSRNLGILLAERKKAMGAIEVSAKIPTDLLAVSQPLDDIL